MATGTRARPRVLGGRGERSGGLDPARVFPHEAEAVARAQRGRLVVEVATADLEYAEERLGPFHPTTEHFREARAESLRGWERLRAELGTPLLDRAVGLPARAAIAIGSGPAPVVLILVDNQAYRADRVEGTELAPALWRLNRLRPALEHGPYYVCRLSDGTFQCDCAGWHYREDDPLDDPATDPGDLLPACKHLASLRSLGWL